MRLSKNMVLFTKDGTVAGNAFIIDSFGTAWKIKTDYGNEVILTTDEIKEMFTLDFDNKNIHKDQLEYLRTTHKYYSNK